MESTFPLKASADLHPPAGKAEHSSEKEAHPRRSSSPTPTRTLRSQRRLEAGYERKRRHSTDGILERIAVLHVEDSPLIVLTSRKTAENAKLFYKSFSSGEEALEYLKEHAVDVVLMDINLSGGGGKWNGYTTAKEIIKLFPQQLIYSASSNDTVFNPLIQGRLLFNGHLGKEGITSFLNIEIKTAVEEGWKKKLGEFSR